MIRNTFQHIPGVGPWRERDLWARGILEWSHFPPPEEGICLSAAGDLRARERIALSEQALARQDLAALAALFPPREHWRLYDAFAERAAFFDIETDGKEHLRPTVVSVFDSQGLHVFIQGRNLDALPERLGRSPIWVTFNGTVFDVPVLQRHFPELPKPVAHVDLRFLCRRARLHGGLKSVEEALGFGRPPHLKGTNGNDAVLLWRAYQQTGDVEALRFLVEYNLYDAFGLRSVLDAAYNRVCDELNCDVPRRAVFERGEILYDVSKLLLELGPTERDLKVLERLRPQDRQLREAEL